MNMSLSIDSENDWKIVAGPNVDQTKSFDITRCVASSLDKHDWTKLEVMPND